MAGAVDDVGRVIEATGVTRPVLVGWSHGATVAVRLAARHPDAVAGLVLVDGAYPVSMFDEAGRQRVREQFRRLGWAMRILAALGKSARMSAAESAEVVIGMDAVNGELLADFAALTCPTTFVVATGTHSGATEDELRTMRAAAHRAVAANPLVSIFATAPTNHVRVVPKSPDLIANAITEVTTPSPR